MILNALFPAGNRRKENEQQRMQRNKLTLFFIGRFLFSPIHYEGIAG